MCFPHFFFFYGEGGGWVCVRGVGCGWVAAGGWGWWWVGWVGAGVGVWCGCCKLSCMVSGDGTWRDGPVGIKAVLGGRDRILFLGGCVQPRILADWMRF